MGFLVIGVKTLLFAVQLLLAIAAVGVFIAALVWILSKTVQAVGDLVGYEVGSLWEWFVSKLPRPRPRRKKR